MIEIYKKVLFSILCLGFLFANAQTNKGFEFWVGYGHHQYMEPSGCLSGGAGNNDMNLKIYLSNTETTTATVVVTIDSSGVTPSTTFTRTYTISPNTVVETENMPKGPINASASGSDVNFDARLWTGVPPTGTGSEGLYRKKGIHIVSDVPIVAYAHIYGGTSSGATMLLPVDSWGSNYAIINSEQGGGVAGAFSWMYVIAKEDNTVVEITPSQTTILGKPAGVPFQITMHKGQIYQLVGTADCITGTGVQLTGTTVKTVGSTKAIAVFAGSSRTGGEATLCGASGRDNDIQQCFPKSSWGKKYLTAPASTSSSTTLNTTTFQKHVYKVLVNDPTTIVTRNGVTLTGLINNSYYQYLSSTADYIVADKPVMVAMFMSSGANCNTTGNGDPEMIYLSPLEQGSKKVGFYRTTLQSIFTNHLTLVIPTAGLSSLLINGSSTFSYTTPHPNLAGYTIVAQNWLSAKAQCIVVSDSVFTGYTYGLGAAESYGYNLGANIATINSIVPVNLADFSTIKTNNDVWVNWKTTNETNFDHFEIERSVNGRDFVNLGNIESKKSGGLYSFLDKDAAKNLASLKNIYYRLKMVDKDGSFSYSKVSVIQLDMLFNSMISVYPNPFVNEIIVGMNAKSNGLAIISIKDISSRTVAKKSSYVLQGSNSLSLGKLENLPKGVYILTVEINGKWDIRNTKIDEIEKR